MFTPSVLRLYERDPRSLADPWPKRPLKEQLLSAFVFDRDSANSKFLPEKEAPGDPILTAYMKAYTQEMQHILREVDEVQGGLTEADIEAAREWGYQTLETQITREELDKKSQKHLDYEAYLLSIQGRQPVPQRLINEVTKVARGVKHLRDEYIPSPSTGEFTGTERVPNWFTRLSYIGPDGNYLLKSDNNIITGTNIIYHCRPFSSFPRSISIEFDFIRLNIKAKTASFAIFKFIDTSVGDLEQNLEAELGYEIFLFSHLQAYNEGYTFNLDILTVDPKGYERMITTQGGKSIDKLNENVRAKLQRYAEDSDFARGTYRYFPGKSRILRL